MVGVMCAIDCSTAIWVQKSIAVYSIHCLPLCGEGISIVVVILLLSLALDAYTAEALFGTETSCKHSQNLRFCKPPGDCQRTHIFWLHWS